MTEQIWNIYVGVATVVNFVLLVALLYWLHKKAGSPLTKYLDDRTKSVASQYEESERAQREARKAAEEARRRLEGLDEEIASMRERAQRQAEATRQELLERAEQEAKRIRESAERYIDLRAEEILRELRSRASDAIVRIAQERISPEARERLHNAFVDDLVRSLDAGAGQKTADM